MGRAAECVVLLSGFALLAACAFRSTEAPRNVSRAFGSSAPVVIQNASRRWKWVVACFATRDTDDDGKLDVSIGRHGETFGDELMPFLILDNAKIQQIDEYIAASPDHRFISVVRDGHLWLVDAQWGNWNDITLLGADVGADVRSWMTHPAVAFSLDGLAAFVRRSPNLSEVVLLQLRTSAATPLYKTEDNVVRVAFSANDNSLRIWRVQRGRESEFAEEFATTLGRRTCRGPAASYSVYRMRDPVAHEDRVPLPRHQGVALEREEIDAAFPWCTADGRRALASTANGMHLVAATNRDYGASLGPLQWVEGRIARNFCTTPVTR